MIEENKKLQAIQKKIDNIKANMATERSKLKTLDFEYKKLFAEEYEKETKTQMKDLDMVVKEYKLIQAMRKNGLTDEQIESIVNSKQEEKFNEEKTIF